MLLRNDVICLQSTRRYNAEDRHRHRQMKIGHIRGVMNKMTENPQDKNNKQTTRERSGTRSQLYGNRRVFISSWTAKDLAKPEREEASPKIPRKHNLFRQIIECIFHVKWVHCHHGMARPRVAERGDGLQIWRAAANMLNKKSRTADSGWSSSLGVGRGASNPPP
jgi:hypothetical protein